MITEGKRNCEECVKALLKISSAIASDSYLENILSLIVNVTAEMMGSRICSLLLLDEAREKLVIRATQSVSEEYNKKPPIKLGEGIAGRVARQGKPCKVMDVRNDPYYVNFSIAAKEGLCSLLCVPLTVKGRVIGVLNCYTSVPHDFNEGEIDILTSIANQAAVAIENAELLVKARSIEAELETRKRVERAKGILMKKEGLSEEQAYLRLRKCSMDNRKSMKEIADAIILVQEIGADKH